MTTESLYPKLTISEREVYEDQKRLYLMLLNSRFGYSTTCILPEIKDVIFNDPATIVFWEDGTKTVVKCQDDDIYDPEKGLTMAISKKALGNKGNYCNVIKKWTEKYYEDTHNIFKELVDRLTIPKLKFNRKDDV